MTNPSQRASADLGDRLGWVGRSWEWVLAFGVLTLLAGIAALAWPGPTLVLLAFIVGAQLVIGGIFQFVRAFATRDVEGGTRVLLGILAVLSFLAGIILLRHPFATVAVLALIVGLFWVVGGLMETFHGIAEHRLPGRGLAIALGLLSILAGLLVLTFPAGSLLTLTLLFGVWLAVCGVVEIGMALTLRHSAARDVLPPAAGPAAAS